MKQRQTIMKQDEQEAIEFSQDTCSPELGI